MLENLFGVPFTLASFLVALTVVVFVHEFGHFLVARRNGVRCQAFSIGFGPELFGYTDKLGTRWKFTDEQKELISELVEYVEGHEEYGGK